MGPSFQGQDKYLSTYEQDEQGLSPHQYQSSPLIRVSSSEGVWSSQPSPIQTTSMSEPTYSTQGWPASPEYLYTPSGDSYYGSPDSSSPVAARPRSASTGEGHDSYVSTPSLPSRWHHQTDLYMQAGVANHTATTAVFIPIVLRSLLDAMPTLIGITETGMGTLRRRIHSFATILNASDAQSRSTDWTTSGIISDSFTKRRSRSAGCLSAGNRGPGAAAAKANGGGAVHDASPGGIWGRTVQNVPVTAEQRKAGGGSARHFPSVMLSDIGSHQDVEGVVKWFFLLGVFGIPRGTKLGRGLEEQ